MDNDFSRRDSALTDAQIDNIWIMRGEIHNGDLMPQLRDFARNVLAAAAPASNGGTCIADNPFGYLYQHDETGRTTFADAIDADFGKNNPRWNFIGPVYTAPPSATTSNPALTADTRDAESWRALARSAADAHVCVVGSIPIGEVAAYSLEPPPPNEIRTHRFCHVRQAVFRWVDPGDIPDFRSALEDFAAKTTR